MLRCGVFCHAQIVKDAADTEAEFAHHLGDGLGRLKRLEDADGETAQARDVFRAVTGTEGLARGGLRP